MVRPAVKREAVAYLQAGHGLSERRAYRIIGADRKMVRYQSRRAPDTELRGRLRELANERRRFVLLRGEGEPSGINRIYRLYREEGLTVRKRKARRKAVGTRAPILVEARANARALSSFAVQTTAGRRDRWISSITSSQTASASGCSTWSMTSPVNAWGRSVRHRPRTDGGSMAHPRSRGGVLPVSFQP
ncbi:hypothetical protein GGQ68_004752 [Sagittula marina]|uniref:HTH-like domain-containing protein n=1 Tax=Sagittula marina TaxID=943940 RepID=A0A7W6DXE8_9RHOB|nr:hypothetical protein [Sagittula marina]